MKRAYQSRAAWVVAMVVLALGLAVGLSSMDGCTKDKRPNVILVIIDTLPASHVASYGYGRSTTPNLDKVAADGILYKKAIAPSPWTLPSVASMFTGGVPSRHKAGIHGDDWTKDDRPMTMMRPGMTTLADMFRDHGYQTVGFFNNPFVDPGFGINQGFDLYNYVEGDNLIIRTAGMVVDEAVGWINEFGEKPFFMVLHFFDPHLAYDPVLVYAVPYVSEYQGELKMPFNPDLKAIRAGEVSYSAADKDFIVGLYDAEVTATDVSLGNFTTYLRQKGYYDNSLVIVTSDHGEEFWEHGGFEHGHSLHREVIEVPLVIKYPGLEQKGKTVSDYVSLCDLFPTVAEFMGWQVPFAIDGVSLYPRGGSLRVLPHPIVSENTHYGPQQQCLIVKGYKMIVNRETGKIMVYNLANDPEETRGVLGEETLPEEIKNQVKKISKDLEALLKSGQAPAANLDRETIEKLKALGYLGGTAKPPPPPSEKDGDTAGGGE